MYNRRIKADPGGCVLNVAGWVQSENGQPECKRLIGLHPVNMSERCVHCVAVEVGINRKLTNLLIQLPV